MTGKVLWRPSSSMTADSTLGRYMEWLGAERGLVAEGYDALWQWSVDQIGDFWSSIWHFFELGDDLGAPPLLPGNGVAGARWFPGTSLNYADRALRGDADPEAIAVLARSQTRPDVELTWSALREEVARCRAGLVRLGVGQGDRVVALLPNIPEAVVAFLATASLGAIWASCAPEFGPTGVLDRFGPLLPTVLLTVAGYQYGNKRVDRRAAVEEVVRGLPTLRYVVEVPYPARCLPGMGWEDLRAEPAEGAATPVPFEHPLYVLFSSGTTGPPKAIVHGHGGILLEHLKALGLHHDLGPSDRFLWFTTTGWMMWNYLVSALCVGSTIVLFDGDPGSPDLGELWRVAGDLEVTQLGTSAPFLLACMRDGLEPRAISDLRTLRALGSTGAPLPAAGFEWVAEQLPGVWLSSISGGTDVCTAFVGGSPLSPVVAGEISCRMLGAAVDAVDADGSSVRDAEGELVVRAPMPSMPLRFWDDDGSRYHAAYFERFPGLWCHGDWVTITDRGTCIISGRSDATLNRGGVRLGTAELYGVVDGQPAVADSLIVHLESDDGIGLLVLFVVLAEGALLDEPLESRLRSAVREALSSRHVPDLLIAVDVIPRTPSGKRLEIPVKRVLMGEPADAVAPGSVSDPAALRQFEELRARIRREGE